MVVTQHCECAKNKPNVRSTWVCELYLNRAVNRIRTKAFPLESNPSPRPQCLGPHSDPESEGTCGVLSSPRLRPGWCRQDVGPLGSSVWHPCLQAALPTVNSSRSPGPATEPPSRVGDPQLQTCLQPTASFPEASFPLKLAFLQRR